MIWYVAQGISFLSTFLFLYSITTKSTKKLFMLGTFQALLNALKNFLLGGYGGSIVQILGMFRSFLKAYDKFNGLFAFLIVFAQIILGVYLNKQGLVGYLPIFASVGYSILLIRTKNIYIIKNGLVINLILWSIYYGILFDVVGVLTNVAYAIYTVIVIMVKVRKE